MREIKSVVFYTRHDMPKAISYQKTVTQWFKKKYPRVEIKHKGKSDLVIVLGGDGTIIEAIRNFASTNPLFMGLNMGHVGFLASVREQKNFTQSIDRVMKDDFIESRRMMAETSLIRDGKIIYKNNFFNDVTVQNLTGVSEIDVRIEDTTIQHIRGTGVLVATASGSTAWNLSLNGPIVMPNLHCFIVTEILDHNTATPSIIIKDDSEISILVKDFRKRDEIVLRKNGHAVDMVLFVDGLIVEKLERGDIVKTTKTPKPVRLIELEKNYFFKSLHQKFTFR